MGSPSTLDDTSFQVHQPVIIKFKRGVQLGNVADEENGAGAARLATVASAGTETTVTCRVHFDRFPTLAFFATVVINYR